jgi:hypothetical protein
MIPGSPNRVLASLPWVTRFRSGDLDEAIAVDGGGDGRLVKIARRSQPLGARMSTVSSLGMNAGASESALAQTIRGCAPGVALMLSMPTGSVFRVGRGKLAPTEPSSVAIAPPDRDLTRTSAPGRDVRPVAAEAACLRPPPAAEGRPGVETGDNALEMA